jgi:hypothetical protein
MTMYDDDQSGQEPRESYGHGGFQQRDAERTYRTINEDHRRTTQRANLSRTSDWTAIFLMGGWRLAMALVLIFFIFVCWALLRDGSDASASGVGDATLVGTPAATALPTMTSTIQIEQVRVRGTGSSGLFLRKEPERADNVVRTLPEGAILQVVGANRTTGDVVWRNVRDDAGNEGWVSAAFLETVE